MEKSENLWNLGIKMLEITTHNIHKCDDRNFSIKAWAITIWSALIGLSYQFNIPVCLSILPIVVFWITDIHYKFFHEQFMVLSRQIELALSKGMIDEEDVDSLLTSRLLCGKIYLHGSFNKFFLRLFRRYWFHLPYISMVLITVLLNIV